MDNLSSPTSTPNSTSHSLSEIELVLYSIQLVLSLLGNILVIAVVFYNENLRTHFNYLIVNMSISDLLIPLLTIPIKISEVVVFQKWLVDETFGKVLCKLLSFLTDISPVVSMYSLVVMAAYRFVAIVCPLRFKLANKAKKKYKVLIAFTWLMATALIGPYFYFLDVVPNEYGVPICQFDWNTTGSVTLKMVYSAAFIFGTYFVPFAIFTILYSIMLCKLYARSQASQELLDDRQKKCRQKRDEKVFRLSMVIILSNALCWGPMFCFIFVTRFILSATSSVESMDVIEFILWYIAYASTVINPCIYFIFIKDFRVGLRKLLWREETIRGGALSKQDNHLPDRAIQPYNVDGSHSSKVKETIECLNRLDVKETLV